MLQISKTVPICADLNSVATGIPRRVAEDDWYNGMLIPKDSTVFLPIWAVHHAEGQGYTDAYKFNPDRYTDHHKLANDYAGSADYSKRDKSRDSLTEHVPADMHSTSLWIRGWPSHVSRRLVILP